MLDLLRSLVHGAFALVTMIPYAVAIMLGSFRASSGTLYWIAVGWLRLTLDALRVLVGVRVRVQGMEHLPRGETSAAVLLCKHQSTFETFLMPTLMPHPLAYVFKKELLSVPFFGWAMARLDMVHIDRSLRAQAFNRVVQQGRRLLDRGIWIIMFPEGTRVPRGERGHYKSGGARLAIETGAPVIPIAVTSARCWPRKAFVKHPGVVDVSIGPPIDSRGREANELMAQVEAWIESEMQRLDPQAYPKIEADATAPATHA